MVRTVSRILLWHSKKWQDSIEETAAALLEATAVFALPHFDWKGAHVYDGKMQEGPLMRSDTTRITGVKKILRSPVDN